MHLLYYPEKVYHGRFTPKGNKVVLKGEKETSDFCGLSDRITMATAFLHLLTFIYLLSTVCSQVTIYRTFDGLIKVPNNIPENVTDLHISSNFLMRIKQADFNFKYPNLTVLKLDTNRITTIEKGSFNGTKNSILISI
jgi:hypothetical protein